MLLNREVASHDFEGHDLRATPGVRLHLAERTLHSWFHPSSLAPRISGPFPGSASPHWPWGASFLNLPLLPQLVPIVSWLRTPPIDEWLPIRGSGLFFPPDFQMAVSKTLMGVSELASFRLFSCCYPGKPDLLAVLHISTEGSSVIVPLAKKEKKRKTKKRNLGTVLGIPLTHMLYLIQS